MARALLPQTLPDVPGLDLAARHRVGSGHEAGSDWFDVVSLPGGWVSLVIGGIHGHDVTATALMGQIRAVVRAYLVDGLPPAAVLSHADAFLQSLASNQTITVCIALVHSRSGIVTLARAGFTGPVIMIPGRPPEIVKGPEGPPLGGAGKAVRRERTVSLPPETVLVLGTDGLVSHRADPGVDGERMLLDLAEKLPDAPADQVADSALALSGTEHGDGAALLLLRWDRTVRTAKGCVRSLPISPSSVVIARWYVGDLLDSWDVGEQVRETAVLLADEIVANAVQHACHTIQLDVTARAESILVEVFDDGHRVPRLGRADAHATSGRGLTLVEALASSWGVRMSSEGLGKTVWFTADR